MYATLRLYKVNPIFEKDFIRQWNVVRNELQKRELLHSATLHKESAISFISYSVWSDRFSDLIKEDFATTAPEPYKAMIDRLKEYVNSMRLIHKMEILQVEKYEH